MKKVMIRQETVTIPTYEIAAYDKNPMFLEKRVYQGSSGRVYPHPVCEGVSDQKTDKAYHAIFLENDYIQVMILPEIGGRIQRLYDKTNGYDAVYYNQVIKPALVGLAGPWISGGIEFNWPQHHRPSTFDPVDYTITENADGSVTVWVGEIEKMFHTKGMAGFTMYPDKAYLEIKGQVYNPTDRPQTFLWWANPAVAVNDNTRSIFPPDVNAVMDHGKRDVSKFPIADGVYYKVNYAPGTDISRYRNIPVPTSYMAAHSDFDFIGNYDDSRQAGLLHIADHHVSPGKKQWTWGNGDFGRAWDRNLTDEDGPYIELMTGVFTDNQPDFTFLKPYEEKSFVQYFMPYKGVGAVKNASPEVVMNLEEADAGLTSKGGTGKAADPEEKKSLRLSLYAPGRLENITASLLCDGKEIFTEELTLEPGETFERQLPWVDRETHTITFRVTAKGRELLSYTPVKREENIPDPAEEIPEPVKLETTEKLFLAATHLEQYRHATYSPEDYYLEGLRRDPSDIRLNNGYGKYLYQKGKIAESIARFEQAVKSSTWKNPNPYDCEPYYNLGLALKAAGNREKAFDAFYKAVWDGNMQDKAFYELACLAAGRHQQASIQEAAGNSAGAAGQSGAESCLQDGRTAFAGGESRETLLCDYREALGYVEKALARGVHNLKARTLKTALLRLCGRKEEAVAFAKETAGIDALDAGWRYELYRLTGEGQEAFRAVMRGDNHNYIELALCYLAAGLYGEAAGVLALAPVEDEPMVHYYRYFCTDCGEELQRAENSSSLYCFPNRLEDIAVLRKAVESGGSFAAYYLGNLLYDRGRFAEAMELWESCKEEIALPTVYRNLSLAYYNKLHDGSRARAALEKAFAMDETDARIFFELDQLYKALNLSGKERLQHMERHGELLERRDDLYTEYITLLNLDGQYAKAYECIMGHQFHPWEGGEGKIPAQYRIALIHLAQAAHSEVDAVEEGTAAPEEGVVLRQIALLEQALSYPHNLGEGKLAGNLDNDIYYMLGQLYEKLSMAKPAGEYREKAQEAYRLAARGEFALASAMYYNDQPPEMMYYAALALKALGGEAEARSRFAQFLQYAKDHENDTVKIDYFAVSLPDFLIFEADLNRKNKVHCLYMAALGHLGMGEADQALACAKQGLVLDACHEGLTEVVRITD